MRFTPIDAYIGEPAGTAWDGVTIENWLQMESGVHWDEGTPVLTQNTQVLAWLLETVYGKPFNVVISEKLWVPMGMAGDAMVGGCA